VPQSKVQNDSSKSTATVVPTMPLVLTVTEVADRLKIPPSSVYEMTRFRSCQNGRSPLPCRRVGRYLRFIATEIDAWLLALPQVTKTAKRKYTKRRRSQKASAAE
jgi:predicted DNA-binding transcriptional regulator AlpA